METLYRQNDYVKYGVNGVCLISDVQIVNSPVSNTEDEYYVLKPVSSPTSKIYVPSGNEILMSKMRRLLSKEEIDRIIVSTEKDDLHWIDDRKERAAAFYEILKRCDQKELFRLVKCIYLQQAELNKIGKKLSSSDESIMKQAEELISNELEFVLQIPASKVGEYIRRLLRISAREQ